MEFFLSAKYPFPALCLIGPIYVFLLLEINGCVPFRDEIFSREFHAVIRLWQDRKIPEDGYIVREVGHPWDIHIIHTRIQIKEN